MSKLRDLSEEELWAQINEEMKGQRRWSIVERMHMRLCALRNTRERLELMKQFSGPRA
jgi:hypothetical protein